MEEQEVKPPKYNYNELINLQKLCTLCLSNEEWPYDNTGALLHFRDGLHHTVGYYKGRKKRWLKSWKSTWCPASKAHPQWEQHQRSLALMKLHAPLVLIVSTSD